jgi:hypothetical protein
MTCSTIPSIDVLLLGTDERDREEFFRLKKVQDKKKEAIEKQKAAMAARLLEQGIDPNAPLADDDAQHALLAGALAHSQDPEVVF